MFGEEEVVSCSYQGTEHFPPSHPMPSSPPPHPSPFQNLISLIFSSSLLESFPSSFYPLAQTVSAEVRRLFFTSGCRIVLFILLPQILTLLSSHVLCLSLFPSLLFPPAQTVWLDSIAASLFVLNWLSWQIVSDDKIQITILILRRGVLSSGHVQLQIWNEQA